ncbi:hypothetical protein [Brucella intermedia]|uniref:hypothetical protein n=1 Tax=Brucella intermedia TaxID=94625 RepID=UPI002361ABE7|nr:hypothetical protein [Brucella intermedia]
MTRIDLYYLAKIQDGNLELTFHATTEERDAVIAEHIETAAALLGVSSSSFGSIVEFEERYEQETGKQMELLTGTTTVPETHPVLQKAWGHIESAITTLDALSILPSSARAELVAALALLGKV